MIRLVAMLLGWVLLSMPSAARASSHEVIVHFKSDIVVHADATLTVTETIKVRAAHRKIKRGIYRDFPTTYHDRHGNKVRVGFEIRSVMRDGKPEAYHGEAIRNGRRVYMGKKDVFINKGVHTYTLTYRTDRQIGYFKKFDELYWNVTGNDWAFPIERAEAVVSLPGGANVTQRDAYTGRRGAKGRDSNQGTSASGKAFFATSRTLGPGEGLTIAVGWPKGIVAEPTESQHLARLLADNLNLIAALIGLPLILAYYLYAWNKVGRDPEMGTIAPLFEPPNGFSPALTRALVKMGPDDKAFSAAVVSMAVKGAVRIDEDDGDFTLVRLDARAPGLSRGEQRLVSGLFSSSRPSIELDQKNHDCIGKAKKAFEEKLKEELEISHYNLNSRHLIPGGILSVLTVLGVVLATPGAAMEEAGFMSVWLTGWTAGCAFLAAMVVKAWRRVRASPGIIGAGGAVFITLFAVPFFLGEFAGLWMLADVTSIPVVLFLLLIGVLFVVFWQLLKAPTIKGRKVLDQIEGFKLFLSVAEKERWATLHPPEETPELFERYLPYALALDVEHQWSEHFAGILEAAATETGRTYRPGWYSGRSWDTGGASGLCSGLSSGFSSALASSASAPGSSGGGSSGGGGGGGGGGGW